MLQIYAKCKDMARRVEKLSGQVRTYCPSQAEQMRRSSKSVRANVAEGSGLRGGNRRVHYERALGSARETRDHLEEAVAERWIEFDPELDDWIDHIIAVMVKLVR